MIHYVYLTTNLINKKQYVGDHSTYDLEKDNYLGSGVEILKALKEYKHSDFTKVILEKFNTRKEAGNKQSHYIKLYKTHISQGGYNISWDGGLCYGDRMHSEETKKIMKEKSHQRIRLPHSQKSKEKNSESHKGKHHSKETKKNQSDSLKIKLRSKETIENMKNAWKLRKIKNIF